MVPRRCRLERPHLHTQTTWSDQVGIFPPRPHLRRGWGPNNMGGQRNINKGMGLPHKW